MSMHKYIILTTIIFWMLHLEPVVSQAPDINSILNELNEPVLFGEILEGHIQTEGSQFFINGWTKGDIHLKNGDISRNMMLQYNGYKDQLYWLNPSSGEIIIPDRTFISGFTLLEPGTDDTLTFIKKDAPSSGSFQTDEIFVQMLVDDAYSLFVFRRIENTGNRNIVQNNRRISLPVLEPGPVYFIRFPDKSLESFQRISRRAVINIFPGIKDDLKRALAERRIRISSEEDLIEVIRIINRL